MYLFDKIISHNEVVSSNVTDIVPKLQSFLSHNCGIYLKIYCYSMFQDISTLKEFPMAAAQVAKKLKDRRQKQTLEEIFRKVLNYP